MNFSFSRALALASVGLADVQGVGRAVEGRGECHKFRGDRGSGFKYTCHGFEANGLSALFHFNTVWIFSFHIQSRVLAGITRSQYTVGFKLRPAQRSRLHEFRCGGGGLHEGVAHCRG